MLSRSVSEEGAVGKISGNQWVLAESTSTGRFLERVSVKSNETPR